MNHVHDVPQRRAALLAMVGAAATGASFIGMGKAFGALPVTLNEGKTKSACPGVRSICEYGEKFDGEVDATHALRALLDECSKDGCIAWIPAGCRVLITEEIVVQLQHAELKSNGFGIHCDGEFIMKSGVNNITIINSNFSTYKIKIGGGDVPVESSGFRLVGGYHNTVFIEACGFGGTVLWVENGLPSNRGGNGRLHVASISTNECGRPIYAAPTNLKFPQNAFGHISFFWSSNDRFGSAFINTQDVSASFVNIDLGKHSGELGGISFDGCSSIFISSLACGEVIANPLKATVEAVRFKRCKRVKVNNLYFISESSGRGKSRGAVLIDEVQDVQVDLRLVNISETAVSLRGDNLNLVKISGIAENCKSRILFLASVRSDELLADIDLVLSGCKIESSGGALDFRNYRGSGLRVKYASVDCENDGLVLGRGGSVEMSGMKKVTYADH